MTLRLWKGANDTVITHTVDGVEFRFAPISFWRLITIKPLLAPLARAASLFFSPKDQDTSVTQRKLGSMKVDGNFGEEMTRDAISVELAKYRSGERAEALEKLIETLLSESNAVAMGRALLYSLPDECDASKVTDDMARELMEDMTPPRFIGMLEGFWKANKDALSPLIDKLFAKARAAQQSMEQGLNEDPSSRTDQSGSTSSDASSSASTSDSPSRS